MDARAWITYIRSRLAKNKNFLCLISGETRSGKSYSALSLCLMLDPNFKISSINTESQLSFKGKDLLAFINSENAVSDKPIMFDEAGIDLGNRTWQSRTNKLLNWLLQTFGHRNLVLFFTTPYADFIDAQTRKLFHAEFKTVAIDYKKKLVLLKAKKVKYDPDYKKFYRAYLKVHSEGSLFKQRLLSIPIPPDDKIKLYEEQKKRFTDSLNKEIQKDLVEMDMEMNGKKLEGGIAKTRVPNKAIMYYKAWERLGNVSEVARIFGVSQPSVTTSLHKYEKLYGKPLNKRPNRKTPREIDFSPITEPQPQNSLPSAQEKKENSSNKEGETNDNK